MKGIIFDTSNQGLFNFFVATRVIKVANNFPAFTVAETVPKQCADPLKT